jgi:tight adherence protein B
VIRRTLFVPAFAALSLLVAGRALAGVAVRTVDTRSYPEVRVTVTAPAGSPQPALTENGKPVAGLHAVNLADGKNIVVAVDRSQSMRGGKLADATAAARTFVAAKGAGDNVEVIAFGRNAAALTRFSASAADADAALTGLSADTRSGTALWDAVVEAAGDLRRQAAPGRVIVVVTDGSDVSSTASLAQAVTAARAARAAVYAVGIAGSDFSPEPLQTIASATGGAYLEASSSRQLTAVYASLTRRLARTWELRYVTAARPGDTIDVVASAAGAKGTQTLALPTTGAIATPNAPLLTRSVWTSRYTTFAIAGAVGLLALLAIALLAGARGGSWLNARLAPHLGQVQAPRRRPTQGGRRELLRGLFIATERALANVGSFQKLQRLLTRGDIPLLAGELVWLCGGLGLATLALLVTFGLPPLIALLLAGIAAAAPIVWASTKASKRMKAFDLQLPDILITLAASLKAGHSFRHAIQAVVDEGAEPAAKEFRRVLTETRLGRPMDAALADMGGRIGSKNLSFVLTSVTIQRQIGGSLAGLFDMVAETVRQRQQFSRKIRSLTAMGRMSAYVLAGLPFGVALMITLLSPTYMAPLWHTSTGHELVLVGFVMLGLGALVLKHIVAFKG